MKTTRALTAALLLAGGAALFSAAPAYADETPVETQAVVEEKVCDDLDTGKLPGGDEEITITAPEGYLIAEICVKAGSAVQGDGPETIIVDPPAEEYTFTHSTEKEISHYSVRYVKKTTETTPPSTTPVHTTPGGGGDGEGKELAETGFDNGWLLFAGLGAIALGGAIAAPRIAAAKRR